MDKYNDSTMIIGKLSVYLKLAKFAPHRLFQGGELPCQKINQHCWFRRKAVDAQLKQRLI